MTEIADILNEYGDEYIQNHGVSPEQFKVINAIRTCRTSKLGGHVDVCDHCGHQRISYNSCRNRHCPKCQGLVKEQWIEKRKKDLLPVQYFHVVFTIPDDLNDLALRNKKEIYTLLFKASSDTLKELSEDPKHLGAKIGFISILHTWGQNLMDHPHIHCIVTGAGLSFDNKKWISARENYFIHYEILSSVFRGKFMAYLKQYYADNKFKFPGKIKYLDNKANFKKLKDILYNKDWVVFAKPSFKNPKYVIEYLGRYTNKVAISNQRIIKLSNHKVTFRYKDYNDKGKKKVMTLDVLEFIRRFLLHVLPSRFVRIRYYGILGNRYRKENLKKARLLLLVIIDNKQSNSNDCDESWQDMLLRLTGIDAITCPECGQGKMIPAGTIPQNYNNQIIA